LTASSAEISSGAWYFTEVSTIRPARTRELSIPERVPIHQREHEAKDQVYLLVKDGKWTLIERQTY
jgi:hypothetical protein